MIKGLNEEQMGFLKLLPQHSRLLTLTQILAIIMRDESAKQITVNREIMTGITLEEINAAIEEIKNNYDAIVNFGLDNALLKEGNFIVQEDISEEFASSIAN